ncbi:hypothetical protein LINPERHAP2_LOCUS39711 [Linum perenne]
MESNIEKKKNRKKKGDNERVKKACSSNKFKSKINTWPDLPHQLIRITAKESTFSSTDPILDKEWSLMNTISSSTITKSWRFHSNKPCHSSAVLGPRIELHNSAIDNGFHQIRLNPQIGSGYWSWGGRWKIPDTRTLDLLGCTCGFLLTKTPLSFPGKTEEEITLWDPFLEMSCFLPEWSPLDPVIFAAVSSSCRFIPRDRKKSPITIVLTGISRPAFAFYTWDRGGEDYRWEKRDCEIVDPNSSNWRGLMKLSNGIWFRGKFYALSLEGTLAVMEEVGSDFRITKLGKKRAVPDSIGMKFRECLVESEGGILLVFLVWRKTGKIVEEVQVYRLDMEKLVWVRVKSLDGAAVFVGCDCCVSVPGKKLLECRGNCVYFVSGDADDDDGSCCWWVYEVESGVISSCGRDYGARTDLFEPEYHH